MSVPTTTLIIPAFDEADRLAAGFARLQTAAAEGRVDLDDLVVVYVDDGSTDDTANVAASLVATLPHGSVITRGTNGGKGAAVRAGVASACTRNLLFTDADMAIMLDAQTPPEKTLHLIVDNYATHKHPKVKAWLAKHPRFVIHFTPTSASWLNMVERFFRDLTVNRLRRDAFKSLEKLLAAIEGYIAGHNVAPKPFIWTAKAADILEKVKRARVKVDKLADK